MTIYEFAYGLNGRERGNEITKLEEQRADDLGYVVVFGYSDDGVELRGAILDEIGCFNGGEIYITKNGLLKECEDNCIHYRIAKESAKRIEINWCDHDVFCWTYETEIPHATFDIYDDGDEYCRGIVFDINNLG